MQFTGVSATERRTLPPAIAVSTVAFAVAPPADAYVGTAETSALIQARDVPDTSDGEATTLWIPLVRRTREPFIDSWALPGGPTEWNETLTDTATRTVHDAVRHPPAYLEQLYSFGAVERSADAQRLVTIAYWAQYGERDFDATPSFPVEVADAHPVRRKRWDDLEDVAARGPADGPEARETMRDAHIPDQNVAWFSADSLPALAFDHDEIVQVALWRLRIKTEYSSIAHRFLGADFTLTQLRRVHEAILGSTVDPANFRRQMFASGTLIDTGEFLTGTAHRPAKLYRFRDAPNRSADPGTSTRSHTQIPRSRQ